MERGAAVAKAKSEKALREAKDSAAKLLTDLSAEESTLDKATGTWEAAKKAYEAKQDELQ